MVGLTSGKEANKTLPPSCSLFLLLRNLFKLDIDLDIIQLEWIDLGGGVLAVH